MLYQLMTVNGYIILWDIQFSHTPGYQILGEGYPHYGNPIVEYIPIYMDIPLK